MLPVRSKIPLLAGTMLLAAGCMTGPNNGTATNAAVVGKTFTFQGYYNEPSTTVQLQVLKTPDADPSVDSNWKVFASAVSGTSPIHFNSTDPLYSWSVTAAPVPNVSTSARWPTGGVVKVRAQAQDPDGAVTLTTFDEVTYSDCFTAHSQDDWMTIGTECAGMGSPVAALVSTLNNPAGSLNPPDYLGRKGDTSEAETLQYYNQIQVPQTLAGFLSKYGFASGDITATYFNDGDLGIGREMHCRAFVTPTAQVGVACYVKNYSQQAGMVHFGDDPDLTLQNAVTRTGAFATVAMVFVPPAANDNSVQFVVYGANGDRVNTAKLDNTGKHVSIPNNCLTCHGINSFYNENTNAVVGAKFLPFDVFSFKYSNTAGFTQADQADALRRLNQLVTITGPTSATTAFINGMYAPKAVSDVTAVANNSYVPSGWQNNKQVDIGIYNGVIKPYCRTCHISASVAGYDFLEATDYYNLKGSIEYDVCNSQQMPQAEHVLKKFWNSGARAYVVTGLDLQNACKP